MKAKQNLSHHLLTIPFLLVACIIALTSCDINDIPIIQQVLEENHSYTETVIREATCSQSGETIRKCSHCGDIQTITTTCTEYSANELFEMYNASVGEIITYDKYGDGIALGTCFVYAEDGKILTNYHVIEDAYSAEITINDNTYKVTQVLAYDKDIDVAVLKINATNLKTMPICPKEHAVGYKVYALGSSKGLTSTFSQGIITSSAREIDGIMYIQHDAAISNGNSGGPLINQYGEVIGINTWTIRDSQNLNFAISMKELDKLSFRTPLTMSEYYKKECDVFTKLKNYTVKMGKYDYSADKYTLTTGTTVSSGTTFTRQIVYNTTDDALYLYLFANADCMISIKIDEVDGVYTWLYVDKYDTYMTGTIYASTYNKNTLLGVSSHNLLTSSLLSTCRELASVMVDTLCSILDTDLSDVGVTAKDLGFSNY